MSDMKCPICQNNLHKINIVVSTCTNDKCKLWGSSIPNLVLEALAQTKQDLEHTRKALGVAVRAIETIKYSKKSDAINLRHKANKALIEIYKIKDQTALEQKDTK